MKISRIDGFEAPKEKSVCAIVLRLDKPFHGNKVVLCLCLAWYKIHKEKKDFSIRQLFREAIREGIRKWEEMCRPA